MARGFARGDGAWGVLPGVRRECVHDCPVSGRWPRLPRRSTSFPPAVTFLLLILVLISCYTYVPTRLQDVVTGTTVRATISSESARALEASLGLTGTHVSGRLLEHTDDRLLLLVRGDGPGVRLGSTPLYQRVDVAVPDVLRVDTRVLNKARTGGLVAALLGVATVVVVRAFGESGPGSIPGSPNPVE